MTLTWVDRWRNGVWEKGARNGLGGKYTRKKELSNMKGKIEEDKKVVNYIPRYCNELGKKKPQGKALRLK